MKNIFAQDKYKEKIYNITYIRILSFEIYKLFIFYAFMSLMSKLSYHFPFSIFYEMEYNFFTLAIIFIYLFIIDIFYFILFKSNEGQFSVIEILMSFLFNPNLYKILPISFSFCILYLVTKEIKSLMPRLDSQYIKNKYNIEPIYRDEYEENYYARKGLSKYTFYEYSERLFLFCVSIFLLVQFIIVKQKFDLWPKLNLGRINNLKNKLWISIKNMFIIGFPSFFIIYIFFIFYYHSLFIVNLCLNYTIVFVIEYNILFISTDCLLNFICAKINYITIEVNTKAQVIKKEIDLKNDETFYIIHHLKHLNEMFKYTHDVKLNSNLLNIENLNIIKNKIYFFMDSINKKYIMFLNKIKPLNVRNNMNAIDKIKIVSQKISELFDFNANKVLENDTSIEILKMLVELNGNIVIFIAEANINMPREEKYIGYCDHIYFFIERLFEMDRIFMDLLKNKKISEQLRKNLNRLELLIISYFNLIKNRQKKYEFIKPETEKIKEILYGKKINNFDYLKFLNSN